MICIVLGGGGGATLARPVSGQTKNSSGNLETLSGSGRLGNFSGKGGIVQSTKSLAH